VQLLLQVWAKTWSFYTQNLLLALDITDKKLEYLPVNSHISYWHADYWMDPHEQEFTRELQQEVLPPIFDPECAIKLQEFEWSATCLKQHFCP
jgi:hypothetical protein